MPDVVSRAPDAPDEHPVVLLLRDPPPPPGYVNPVEQSQVLEQPSAPRDGA